MLGKEYIQTATIANIRYKKHSFKMFSPIQGFQKLLPQVFMESLFDKVTPHIFNFALCYKDYTLYCQKESKC